MCKAFSCIVARDKTVTWQMGVDSHTALLEKTKLKDNTADPILMTFARVEITPKNRNYLFPDEWILKVDERIKPTWFDFEYAELAKSAHKLWLSELDKLLIRKPIVHPFKLPAPKEITKEHIALLKTWDSVGDSVWDSVGASVRDSVRDSVWGSVRDSVWDSVWDSVGDSVGDSVRDSVWDSVRGSVWGSVWGYIGSFFNLPKWKEGYPFASLVTLWEQGLVPSFDGKTWRLHAGPKAEIVFSIDKKDL